MQAVLQQQKLRCRLASFLFGLNTHGSQREEADQEEGEIKL